MPEKTIKVFLPAILQDQKDALYFKGYFSVSDQTIVIYLVEHSYGAWKQSENEENIIYGVWNLAKTENNLSGISNFLVFKYQNQILQMKKLTINGNQVNYLNNCIVIFYEHGTIKDTEISLKSNDEITELQFLLQKRTKDIDDTYKPVFLSPSWLTYSMIGQHVFNCVNLGYWFITSVWNNKKISLRQGNLILAVLVDILLGYLVLQYVMKDEEELSDMLMDILEKLVNSLYTLLKWLMGAPAGLKLNNAFNKMLGKYFSYHIQLWWLFLDVTGEKLVIILHLFRYIGYAGITFQAAIISDMICIATFHSYCIYVYAARLFNIQVSGLIALLRLFVGRKYNPLRGGIDSCEYTNQELFVGTVAFTILLLLMPTTAMYYAVFTLFRLLSLVVQHILAKLVYFMQTQSLYVIGLWLTNSSKVAGNILLEVISNEETSPVTLRLKLFKKSINELVKNSKPPVEVPKQVEWTNLFSNILMGNQII